MHGTRNKLLAVLAAMGTALVGSVAVVAGPATTANAASVRYGGVLHVVMPWGSIVDNFNPLAWDGGTGTTAGGTGSLLYEPLFYVNQYTNAVTPLLGRPISGRTITSSSW